MGKYKLKTGKKLIVVPARMASRRLPGKPLLEVAGRSLLRWTYEQAKKTTADHVVVATSDAEIARHCQVNDIPWMLTRDDHESGTSRCSELFDKLKPEKREEIDTIVNWQVDEPSVSPSDVNILMSLRVDSVGTLVYDAVPPTESTLRDPNVVKVVHNERQCFWFSRAPMAGASMHVGLYSFSPFLLNFVSTWKTTRLAAVEGLEQLTWLEHGAKIAPVRASCDSIAVNDEASFRMFRSLKERENQNAD